MRNPVLKSTREEIRQKLLLLYSDSLDSGRNVLDFDKSYDFFSNNESLLLKFSSNWFRPEKYNSPAPGVRSIKHYQNVGSTEGGNQKICWPHPKQESILKVEKPITSLNLTRDLEVLGRTPYQLGVDGEKFRVVAATLQKCNSPFVRRTFHFTSNGIVEAPEKKNESESLSVIPILKQSKIVAPPQKFVRIRRFRVIKRDDLPTEKCLTPQKIKITNGDKTRFLTVRIRPKNANVVDCGPSGMGVGSPQPEMQKVLINTEKREVEVAEMNSSSTAQTEEPEEVEQFNSNVSEPDTSSASLDLNEEDVEGNLEEPKQIKQEESEKEEKPEVGESYNCKNCGKHFPTYLSCLSHFRSHQRQICELCSKKFLTVKMLRDHMKMQHQHQVAKSGTSEDRITTATSKFGRTRQVLNVAGLRSKYKML